MIERVEIRVMVSPLALTLPDGVFVISSAALPLAARDSMTCVEMSVQSTIEVG